MEARGTTRLLAMLVVLSGCGKAEVFGLSGDDSGPAADAGTLSGDAAAPDAEEGDAVGPNADAAPLDLGAADSGELADTGEDSGAIDEDAAVHPDAQPLPDSGDDAGNPPPPDSGVPAADSGVPAPDGGAQCMVDRDCGLFGHCDTQSGTCVDCLVDMDCIGGRICDTAGGHVCRTPCSNGMCGPFGFCDPSINACVECLMDSQCNNGQVCEPVLHSCVECADNADCAAHPGAHVCDLSSHSCTGCLSNTDCPSGQECQPGNFCASPTARGLCEPCLQDGDCAAGSLCIGFGGPGGGIFDRSCSPDCAMNPMGCDPGFACTSVRQGSAQVCRPAYAMDTPTCTAVRHLGQPCLADPGNLDPGCGLTGVRDARCEPDPNGAAVCTVWCEQTSQCPSGTTCVGASTGQVGSCF